MKKITGILLMTLAVFLLMFARSQAESEQNLLDKCMGNMKTINEAAKNYAKDHHGQYPLTFDEMTKDQRYLKTVVQCPKGGYYTYAVNKKRSYFAAKCPNQHYIDKDTPVAGPFASSANGVIAPSRKEYSDNLKNYRFPYPNSELIIDCLDQCKHNISSLGKACELFYKNNHRYPVSLYELKAYSNNNQEPLETLPACQIGEIRNYEYLTNKECSKCFIKCPASSPSTHTQAYKDSVVGFPAWSSEKGFLFPSQTEYKNNPEKYTASEDLLPNELNHCVVNLKNIATACEMYFVDFKKYPVSLKELLKINPVNKCSYLKWLPDCPSCGKNYEYITGSGNQTCRISCPCGPLGNHTFPPKGYPSYDSKKGFLLPSEYELKNNPAKYQYDEK